MKCVVITVTAAMLLSFGSMAPAYAQHERQGEKQSDKQDEKRDDSGKMQGRGQQDRGATQHGQQAEQQRPARPQERQPQQAQRQPQQLRSQPQQSEQHRSAQSEQTQRAQQAPQPVRGQQSPQRSQEQARTWQQQKGWAQNGASPGHATFQQNRAQHWSAEHRTWAQRGGYGGYYVPRDRFNASFGSQHVFSIHTRPVMYLGYPRFDYGGFSFLMVDPWPEYWSDNWYSSEEVYIDYDDGYYLYDRRDPKVRLAIAITL